MKPLLDAFSNAIAAADLLQGKLGAAAGSASPQQIAGYRQYGQSRQQGEEMLRLGKAYADEAARQNSLSKDQLAVEKEIATIKKDLASSGAFLNDNDVKALAQRNVAAEGARGKGGGSAKAVKQTAESRFEGDLQAVRDRTAALVEEQRIIGLSYRAQEERRMALDLEQSALADLREEARRKGQTDLENIRLSDLQVAKIREASAAYAEQADALRIVEEAQQSAQDSASEFYDTAKAGFVDVIKGTTSLGDALANLGSKLADLALNSAFDSIFGGSKATGGGGWLTGIFKSLGFAAGGYTGPGGKFQPAGVVHKGEYVFDQESVRAAGGPGALDAMRRGLKGYAGGGAVGVSAPTMPRLVPSAGGASISATYAPQIDARGADSDAVDRLERIIAQDRASFSGRVVQAVQNAQKRNAKV
jgi:lambda family phage tail tape measure protein